MLKRAYSERVTVTNCGWASLDATDLALIDSGYKKSLREGEERLMLAVLENGVECFQNNVFAKRPSRKQLFQEAEEWFLDTENEALYSFENICETLGFHPDRIRKGLMAWKEAKLKVGNVDNEPLRSRRRGRYRGRQPTIRVRKSA